MSKQSCDACGRTITVAGGIANLWTLSSNEATGLTLELEDGSTHLLCYPCIGALPEHPAAEDVAALEASDRGGADGGEPRSEADATADGAPSSPGDDRESGREPSSSRRE